MECLEWGGFRSVEVSPGHTVYYAKCTNYQLEAITSTAYAPIGFKSGRGAPIGAVGASIGGGGTGGGPQKAQGPPVIDWYLFTSPFLAKCPATATFAVVNVDTYGGPGWYNLKRTDVRTHFKKLGPLAVDIGEYSGQRFGAGKLQNVKGDVTCLTGTGIFQVLGK